MKNELERRPSPLSAHPLFVGEDVDQARQILSSMFTDISLEPKKGDAPFSADVFGVELPNVCVTYLRFGQNCVAGPLQRLDFHTLQLTQSGSCGFDIQTEIVPGSRDESVMLSAGQRVRVHHSDDNGILCLIVKDKVLRDYIATLTGTKISQPLQFAPRIDTTAPLTASFLSYFHTFVKELSRPGGLSEFPAAVASFEHAMITSLLFGLEHNLTDVLKEPKLEAGAGHVRQIEQFLEAHAEMPINMQTIAQKHGHSISSIYRAFKRHRGYTPMAFLRRVRMRLARQQLLQSDPDDSVTNIAMRCGFAHLGRFAVEYKRLFGESPSETFRRRAMKR